MPKATDQELNSSPFRIDFEVTLADGDKIGSHSFIPKGKWDSLNDEQRLAEVKEGLGATTAAVLALVEKHAFPAVPVLF